MLKAVIFDMDGVLIDSEPVHLEAFKRLMNSLGKEFEVSYYMQFIGSTTDNMWNIVRKDFGLTLMNEEFMEMSDKYVAEINGDRGYPVMKGAAELVGRLHEAGLKLAVASSSGMERISRTLEKMGVTEMFDAVVSGMLVDRPKPAPDTFLKAAELLGVNQDECIVIEDSINGMKAAKNADMVCVMYENNSLGAVDSTYSDYIIQGFEDLDASFFEMVYSHVVGEP